MYQKHLFIANIDNTAQSWVIIRLRKILLRYWPLKAHLDTSHLPTCVFVQTWPPILNCRRDDKYPHPSQTEVFPNRPFPSSPRPLYQNEVTSSAFNMEMIFHSHANKTHFHKNGCALGLIFKVRVFGTRKWPILTQHWTFVQDSRAVV